MKALRSPAAKAVAAVLKRARAREEISQRELAARLKRPHSVVGMIESQQRQVNVPEFLAIAEALDADPIDLFRQVLRERDSQFGYAELSAKPALDFSLS